MGKARSALSDSLDPFVVLFASFPSALQFVGNLTTPGPPLYLQVRRAIGTP